MDAQGFLLGLFLLSALSGAATALVIAVRRPALFGGRRTRRIAFVILPLVLFPIAVGLSLAWTDELGRSGPAYGARLGLVAAIVARICALCVRRRVSWILSAVAFVIGLFAAIAVQHSSVVMERTNGLYAAVLLVPLALISAISLLATDGAQAARRAQRLSEPVILLVLAGLVGFLVPSLVARRRAWEAERPLREALAAAATSNVLDLAQQKLKVLPDEIGALTQLKRLDLTGCELPSLPKSLELLTALEEIDLTRNQLVDLDQDLAHLALLPKLRVLKLGDNRLTRVSDRIGQLRALEELDLSHNQLTALPPAIGQLVQLRVLTLGNDYDGNHLTTLPAELALLTHLQTLSAARNQLVTLPDALWKLSSLQSLDLSHNQIEILPAGLSRLTGLQSLSLQDNPVRTIENGPALFAPLKQLITLTLPELPAAAATELRTALHAALPRTQLLPE